MATIEDRLRSHSREFSSLLGLIPTKYYYSDKDNSNQWNRRKQSKMQSVTARKAKLDPYLAAPDTGMAVGKSKGKKRKNQKEKKGGSTATPTHVAAAYTNKNDEEEAQEIALDNFTFSAELEDSPSPTPPATAKDTTIATDEAVQRASQRARLAEKIQGLEGQRRGDSSANSSKRKNAEIKKVRKKDRKRQKAT